MKQLFALMVGCVFALGIIALLMNLRGLAPTPEQYAAATATAQRAADESVRYQIETQATATYVAKRIEALPTQIPTELDTENRNKQTASWWFAGIAISIVALLLVIVGVVRLQGQFVSRGEDGQAKIRAVGNTTVDTQAMIGPAVSVQEPDASDQFWHAVIGKPLPAPKIVTSDAGASSAHLLIARQSANQTTGISALMRGGLSEREREKRIKIVREDPVRGPDGTTAIPGTTVVEGHGVAVDEICDHLGISLAPPTEPRQLTAPRDSDAVLESVWTEAETVSR